MKTAPNKYLAREYLNEFANWRKKEWKFYEEQRDTKPTDQTFEWVSKNKIETCGTCGEMAAKLFALYHPQLSTERIEIAQKSFIGFMLAAQVYDDKKDFLEDEMKQVPNLFNAALNKFPNERKAIFDFIQTHKNQTIRGRGLFDLAPQAMKLCDEFFEYHLATIESSQVKKLVADQYRKRYLNKRIEIPKEVINSNERILEKVNNIYV